MSALIRTRPRTQHPAEPPRPTAIVAAASQIKMDGTGWQNFKLGDEEWEREAWRHYDINGHLRYASNWIGNAISRCRTTAYTTNEKGEPGEEIDPERDGTTPEELRVAEIADDIFGGQLQRSEAYRLQAIQMYTGGASYTIAEGDTDQWYVASTSQVSRQGDKVVVKRSNMYGGGYRTLDLTDSGHEGSDLLIRTWTPHPRFPDMADSSVRAALPILREYEQLTKLVFAQIDSRLAGAGVLFLPSEIDFPRTDSDPPNATGLMRVFERNASTSLSDHASPRRLVPLLVQVDGDQIDKIKWMTFETPLQEAAMELRKEAVRNLAISLDIPPEVLLGMGDTNHWSAWQIEEQTIQLQIVPLMSRITDALNTFYFRPALEAEGIDPDNYILWYDTSALVVRPNRQTDALALYEAGELSGDALRAAGDWPEESAPEDEERLRRLAEKLVIADPQMLLAPGVQAALGVDASWAAQPPGGDAGMGGPDTLDIGNDGGPSPLGTDNSRALPQETPTQNQAALLLGAHLAVLRALEVGGKRLLTRANRDQYPAVRPEELHVHIPVADRSHAERLLTDVWGPANELADFCGLDTETVRAMLHEWCVNRMTKGMAHDLRDFLPYMNRAITEFGAVR